MAYGVLYIAYSVKINAICPIFNKTGQDDVSETAIKKVAILGQIREKKAKEWRLNKVPIGELGGTGGNWGELGGTGRNWEEFGKKS